MPSSAESGLQVLPAPPGRGIADCIGNTPLLRVRLFERQAPDLLVLAKAEFMNPGGSVKDRPAVRMVREAIRLGQLGRGQVLLDSTSGNTGVAYAMLGAALDFPVQLAVPRNVGEERRRLMLAYGAELTFSDPQEGSDGAIRLCREIESHNPRRYFTPDQYSNPFNWKAHYDTTAVEIWEQTDGEISLFLAGLGTSGTFIGTARRLKEFNPAITCVSLQPEDAFHGLEGLKHMASAIVPGIYDPSVADRNLDGPTGPAYDLVRRLAIEQGILAGHSSGLALWGVEQLIEEGLREGVVVVIFPDGGGRYLSSGLYGSR
ncbi:MAG: PLP-dependent cysteine synthase family protein [Candidatus Dormibacteria bacterium]